MTTTQIEIRHQETREIHKFTVNDPDKLTPSEVSHIAKEMGDLKALFINGKFYKV